MRDNKTSCGILGFEVSIKTGEAIQRGLGYITPELGRKLWGSFIDVRIIQAELKSQHWMERCRNVGETWRNFRCKEQASLTFGFGGGRSD